MLTVECLYALILICSLLVAEGDSAEMLQEELEFLSRMARVSIQGKVTSKKISTWLKSTFERNSIVSWGYLDSSYPEFSCISPAIGSVERSLRMMLVKSHSSVTHDNPSP